MAVDDGSGGRKSRLGGAPRRGSGGSFSNGPRRSAPSAPTRSSGYATKRSAPSISSVAPISSGGGGGGYSGGGTSYAAAAPAPVAPPPPKPMKDIDWFAQDSIYRADTGRALNDLTSSLAQILADRDEGYRQLDVNRDDLARGRTEDLRGLGDDFAGRGLLGSGLYAQEDDELQADYARQGTALDGTANRLAQMFGQRNNTIDLKGLTGNSNLSGIWGLLGSMGMGAGNTYNNALARARAESAGRSTEPLIQTTNW